MDERETIGFRKATDNDIAFLSEILVRAASASGVDIPVDDLSTHPDTYQYIEGFPNETDLGIIAEKGGKHLLGAAWIRSLPTDLHAVHEPLPELTMGVIPEYKRQGVGERLLEELYKAASARGIPKISLGVHKDNLPAVHLYKKQNWNQDGHFEDYIMMSRKTDE